LALVFTVVVEADLEGKGKGKGKGKGGNSSDATSIYGPLSMIVALVFAFFGIRAL